MDEDPQSLAEVFEARTGPGSRLRNLAQGHLERVPSLAETEDRPIYDVAEWWELRWTERIPRRFQWARMGDLDTSAPWVHELAEWAASAEHPRPNVVLVGPVGAGKTHAAVAASRVRHEMHREHTEFWSEVLLLDGLRPGGAELTTELWQRIAYDAHVLVLDDLGTSKRSEWTAERLYALVNERWLGELPIVATTNLAPHDLQSALGARLTSRLVGDDALVLSVTGRDRRLTT